MKNFNFDPKSLYNLTGHTVFITGAAGQLGSCMVKAFNQCNAKVIATDIDISNLKEQSIKYSWDEDQVLIKSCDITKKESVTEAININKNSFPPISILINNAAISVFENYLEREESSIDLVMDVNIKGVIFCIQEFIKNFIKYKIPNGSIINIGSYYGIVSPDPRIYTDSDRKNSEIYGASKAGIIQMTKYFAVHASKYGIRTNSVSPGGILNEENPQGEDFQKNYSYRCPLSRMAKVDEIVGSVVFLASSAASYINGHNLIIDGGSSSW